MKVGDKVSFRNTNRPSGTFVVENITPGRNGRLVTVRAENSGIGYTCYEQEFNTAFQTLALKAISKTRTKKKSK